MKRLLFGILIALLLGCSQPGKFYCINNSGHPIVVGYKQTSFRKTIAPGETALVPYDPSLLIWWEGVAHRVKWRGPSQLKDFYAFGKTTEPFAVSLEADNSIYAHRMNKATPLAEVPAQPPGFPLVPEIAMDVTGTP